MVLYVRETNDVALIWVHLKNAGIIQGSYTGTLILGVQGNDHEKIGVTSPRSEIFSHAGYGVATIPVDLISGQCYPAMTDDKNYLVYGSDEHTDPSNATLKAHRLFNAAITSKMAYRIDSKLDDGKPGQGIVLTYSPLAPFLRNCATSNDEKVAKYKLSETGIVCSLAFQIR